MNESLTSKEQALNEEAQRWHERWWARGQEIAELRSKIASLDDVIAYWKARAGDVTAPETSGRIRPQERHAMFIASQCREVEQPARQLLADLYERSRHWPRADEPTPEKAKVSPAAVLQDDPSIPEGMCLCPHCGAVRTQEGCKLTDPSRCKFHASAQQAECAGCGFAHAPDYKDCVWLKNPY